MENCQFCKIIQHENPADVVWEGDNGMAFLDIRPFTPGHTLLIPKEHLESVNDVSPEVFGELASRIPPVAQAILRATGAEGFNTFIATGVAAGQEIPHLHIHIVPRTTGDGVRFEAGEDGDGSAESRADIAKRIRSAL